MRKRRVDKLGRSLNRIKLKTPWIFSRYCAECDCYVRGEPMWRYHSFNYSSSKVWTCMACAPDKLTIIKQNKTDFKDVDTTPLTDDKARAEREEYLRYT
jgi:hypothetical protein